MEGLESSEDGLPDLFDDARWAVLAGHFGLSRRQRQIARLICLGFSNRAVGRELGLKADTIRMHNRGLFRKLRIRDRIGIPIRLVMADRELPNKRKQRV
jgi:DNA-binding NarL/FixJ family response regulator